MSGPRKKEKSLKDLLPADVLFQPLKATTKESAIGELLNALVIQGAADLAREGALLEAFLEREKVASTGIGNGLAIPHIKSKFADKMTVGVGTSEVGIDFGAHDGEPARIIIMWICAPAETQAHLALMRGLAAMGREAKNIGALTKARDRRAFLAAAEAISVEPKTK
ncbi:MAG TPA: PTS sugar transporter subunit IIA [Planctomycetota bacterium]|nr:PTS sugar transporter subunit IIA [Planctomycetota bacterium]